MLFALDLEIWLQKAGFSTRILLKKNSGINILTHEPEAHEPPLVAHALLHELNVITHMHVCICATHSTREQEEIQSASAPTGLSRTSTEVRVTEKAPGPYICPTTVISMHSRILFVCTSMLGCIAVHMVL